MEWTTDLERITREVCASMLGFDLGEAEDSPASGVSISAVIHLSGSWVGTVTLATTQVLARRAAGAMFMADPASVSEEEVRDAIGELANVIGGQLKPLVDAGATLSMPTVVEGESYRVATPHTRVVGCARFENAGDPLTVVVHNRCA